MNIISFNIPLSNDDDQPVTLIKTTENIESRLVSKIPKIPIYVRCLNCDINFSTKYHFERHHCESIEIETKPNENDIKDLQIEKRKTYICATCGKQFFKRFNFQRHLSIHRAPRKDEQATKDFGSPKELLTQDSVQQKNCKVVICEYCGKVFNQRWQLMRHIDIHKGNKPFACTYDGCTARFILKSILNDHRRKVHTRERPFKCNTCNKSFLTGSVYYQHCLIHKNDRRYGCEICEKRFLRSDALNKHRRIHSGEKPYSCEICSRTFRQKYDLTRHTRTKHPTNI